VANFALNTARFGLPADFYEKYLETMQKTTADEVQLMAKKFVHPDQAHILVVGNKDDVADRLKQFSADGKVNFYDVYGIPVKYSNATLPPDMTAEKVIEDYLNAIGGVSKIAALHDIQRNSTIALRGPELGAKSWQKDGKKIVVETSMNGQVVSKRVFDGTEGTESGMGGATRKLEGENLEDLKEQAAFSKEALYKSAGYKLKLKGVEDVNGSNAYAIEVVRPDGKKSTDYYDMKSSLKVRETGTRIGQTGEPVEVLIDFADYKPANGVLFPNKISISGFMPVPMVRTVTDIKVNAGIDDSIFKL
jgi:hypothetical protein